MLILVVGGARSGKSEVAEELIVSATVSPLGTPPAPDRSAQEQSSIRPEALATTTETPNATPAGAPGAARDAVSTEVTYVAAGGMPAGQDPSWDARVARHRRRRPSGWHTVEVPAGGDLLAAVDDRPGWVLVDSIGPWLAGVTGFLVDAPEVASRLAARPGPTVVVSDEVGLGVHPLTDEGRRFADALGELNRALADRATRVILVVAGRPIELPPAVSSVEPSATDTGERPPASPQPSREATAPEDGAVTSGVRPNEPARELDELRAAVGFLTVLGGDAPVTGAALPWFPFVGAALGAAIGILGDALAARLGGSLAGAVGATADAVVTGGLHLDGLADAADGLFAPAVDPARRLAAMADPSVGAFGTVAVALAIGLRAALLGRRPPVGVVAGLWALGRTAMAVGCVQLPYARAGGLASAFRREAPPASALALSGGLLAAAISLLGRGGRAGLVGLGAGGVGALSTLALARRRLGGFTGDILGATGVLTETVGLLAWALASAPGRPRSPRARHHR